MLDLSLMLSSMNDTSFNDAMMPAPPARVKPGRALALRRRFVHLEEYAAGRSKRWSIRRTRLESAAYESDERC